MAANEISARINVDVSEALTGLKAIQREAKKAAQALRELEATQRRVSVPTYEQRLEAAGAIDLRDNSRIIDLGNGYCRIEPINPTKRFKAEVSE
ncbi:hypothetical protein PPSQR21_032330 [Paenibacillus polymyxa SQR-21]|uniref:hypothetical protein n=1 Tax=Paenibacillus polymyxa TaxID=1406 RepID=UPI00042F2694|nr:hypothetical protein [Paenibacillus polymyxa]AHM66872.1 hypothetical protein PPSQR21_032330 [Paenibacillus polymyxa SQR-21]